MDVVEVLLGIGVLAVTALALRSALPRDGQVRSFLRNEQAQTYYTIAVIAGLATGVSYIIKGIVPG